MKYENRYKLAGLAGIGLMATVLAGCVTGGADAFPPAPAAGTVRNEVVAPAASMVVMRPLQSVAGQAVNIFINGEYLTSLQPGAFRQGPSCPGSNRMTAALSDVSTHYKEKVQGGQTFQTPSGQVSYFQVVSDAAGKPMLQQLDAERGQAMAAGLREQVHTMRRVELNCVVPLKTYTLQASTLFPFDRSDYGSMLEQGKQAIRQVAQDIAASKGKVERIEVVGHTDPEGSLAYNENLSLRRAETVRSALGEAGLPAAGSMTAAGRAFHELVVRDCRARHPRDAAQRKECDQPNRRVAITVFGKAPAR